MGMGRNILVRNLDEDTAKCLDAFKKKHNIKTDAKAVVRMINQINQLDEKINTQSDELNDLWLKNKEQREVHTNLKEGFDQFFKFMNE